MILAIDGNYILYRNVFPLFKENLLYGYLIESLAKSVETYIKRYPFERIYFISDSGTNWRKNIYPEYKSNRKKSDDIDWEFVRDSYEEFKDQLPTRVKVLEADLVEGDDWFAYLCKQYNEQGKSVMMISADGDLHQLVEARGNYINFMVNENQRHDNIYLPDNYRNWVSDRHNNLPLPGLFDDYSDEYEELEFIKKLVDMREIKEVDPEYTIFEKIVSGDRGDNIKTVWGKPDKNGNIRGLGVKSAEKLYQKYIEYFGRPIIYNEECFDRISDIIIEFKKLEQNEFNKINENIIFNNKLVNFDKIPDSIIDRIKQRYEKSYQ